MRETWVRLRQHMITGFLFIMPVLITLAVLGRFWKDMLRVGGVFSGLLRVDTILGPSGNAVLAIVFFLIFITSTVSHHERRDHVRMASWPSCYS